MSAKFDFGFCQRIFFETDDLAAARGKTEWQLHFDGFVIKRIPQPVLDLSIRKISGTWNSAGERVVTKLNLDRVGNTGQRQTSRSCQSK